MPPTLTTSTFAPRSSICAAMRASSMRGVSRTCRLVWITRKGRFHQGLSLHIVGFTPFLHVFLFSSSVHGRGELGNAFFPALQKGGASPIMVEDLGANRAEGPRFFRRNGDVWTGGCRAPALGGAAVCGGLCAGPVQVGAAGGVDRAALRGAGRAFHHAVELVTGVREAHSWLLLLLPAAGLAVVFLYRKLKVEGRGHERRHRRGAPGQGLPWTLLPAIFLSTVLTHLFGGSAGREGAALQMGGTVGYHVGRLFRLDDRDLRTATMTGMAAFFTALFGTPLAATVFAMMVISVGVFYHADFIPCLVASLVAFGVSILMALRRRGLRSRRRTSRR